MGRSFDPDTKLLKLSVSDYFTLRDAYQSVLITGAVGSGKTTGSGQWLAGTCIGGPIPMGGLVLVAKAEEANLWRSYCARHGRTASLIEFDGEKHGFNFIAYELARHGAAGLNSVVECLMRILEIARAVSASGGRQGEAFWEDTTRQILRNSIPVLFAATGTVRIGDLLNFVRSAPTAPEQMRDPEWQQRSYFFSVFADATRRLDDATGERAVSYWQNDFATLDVKTRGNIAISLTTSLDRFNHGWLQRAFCSETTVVPELMFHGAIILLNMPALTRNEDGIIAQQLFKYMAQRAILARNDLEPRQRERPVFIWADEAQYFLNSYDAEFLSTCRASHAFMVFLSQSLPTYYAKMSGENARDRVHHLLGNFGTKIWHNLGGCPETSEWAAKTVGRAVHQRSSYNQTEGTSHNSGMNMGDGTNRGTNSGSGSSFSYNSGSGSGGSWSAGASSNWGSSQGSNENRGRNRGYGTSESTSSGYSEQMDHLIEPAEFSRMLRTGGPPNGNRVSAFWYQASRRFEASGRNVLLTEFEQ